jgi:hypothetical protein
MGCGSGRGREKRREFWRSRAVGEVVALDILADEREMTPTNDGGRLLVMENAPDVGSGHSTMLNIEFAGKLRTPERRIDIKQRQSHIDKSIYYALCGDRRQHQRRLNVIQEIETFTLRCVVARY